MLNYDKSALLCDLAETYHIYDIKALPLSKVALFSVGLRDDSRIKMKLAKVEYTFDKLLMASILDQISILVWSKTESAARGRNKPKSLLNELLHIHNEDDLCCFNSSREFDEAIKKIKEGVD